MSAGDDDANIAYKIVLAGDTGVGKTNILRQFVSRSLPKTPHPTIGVEFATKVVELENRVKVKAQIWDTAGQERYKAITSAHYRNAVGALLVYDITRHQTYLNAKRWADELKFHAGDDIKILLAGNKLDIVKANPSERQVTTDEASRFAHSNGMLFNETSAYSDTNITESFQQLLQEIYEKVGENRSPAKDRKLISVTDLKKEPSGTALARTEKRIGSRKRDN